MKSYAEPFNYNIICEVCREKIKASEAIKRWDGLIVGRTHEGCFEERHPSDLPRPPVRDNEPLPFIRPEQEDTFVSVCTVAGRSAIPGLAQAGCTIPGFSPEISTMPSGTFNEGTL